MTAYAAFLRAVNVGGSGKLSMADLRALAAGIGARDIASYIASGNLAFCHPGTPAEVRAALETALENHMGKRVGVLLRTLPELDALLDALPFPDAPSNRVIVLLIDDPPRDPPEEGARNLTVEEVRPGPGALFIHYPEGQGRSRLTLPAMNTGTGRNLNTLRKMRGMLVERGGPKKG